MLAKYVRKKTQKINKNDLIQLNGIIIGRSYRNNKYIIQLIKPDKFDKLPQETLVNDERVEISEQYLKHIQKREVKEANITPSLTDRVSITERKQSDDKSDSSINGDLTERNIEEEWYNIIGDNDANSMAMDAAETCDSWTLNDCDSCKRISFCLSYYRLWIMHKYKQQKRQKQENNNNNNNNGIYKEYLIDFIKSLHNYSSTQMLNDFHHIKQFHINNNNQNNHSINSEDKQDIFEFFKKEMGICNYMNCRSYSRNNRDRNDCSESHKLRRNLYFIDESKIIEKNEEITETNIQQLLDMIHCTLLHPQNSTLGSGTNGKLSKFITEIEEKGGGKKEEKDNGDKADKGDKKGDKEEDDDKDDEKEDKNKEKEKVETTVLTSYGFGAQFKYHDKKDKMYIKAKYKNLKIEILNNTLYDKINEFDYDSLSQKANDYLTSYRGRSLRARTQSRLNNICKIKPNTAINLDSIIALMLYTNMDDLQREFKKGCRFLIADQQKLEPVKTRNKEIANWCRLLWESITFYGESINTKQVFYHGLNCKLLFNSVIAVFNCPTSTTINKSVAFNFSTDSGIIVQLTKHASIDSHYLDVSDLSDYPNEQERLFFQAQLGFQDIIYNNTSNKYFIKCLNLFQNITKGNFFTHNTKIFKNKHQKTLIKMMDSCMNIEKKEENKEKNNKKKQKKKIPTYMQQLFEHYCKSIKLQFSNIIWLNKEEFSKLNEDVRQYLGGDDNSNNNLNNSSSFSFIKWLQKEHKMKIKHPKTTGIVVQNENLDLFWDGKSVMLPTISYLVKYDKSNKETIVLKIKLKKGATKTDRTCCLLVKIDNKKLPHYVQKLKCDFGVFCPQIQFSFTTTTTLCSKKLQGIPLCDDEKLEGLDVFEWKIFVKFRWRVDSKNLQHKF